MFQPGWFLIAFIDDHLEGHETFQSSPGSDLFPIYMERQTFLFSEFKQKILLQFKLPWRLQICLSRAESWLVSLRIVWRIQNKSNRPGSNPIPIFYGTPNIPIIIVQTQNSSSTQTSMAATKMFEPGWILIGFIENRLRNTKQFNPARLKLIPI